MKELGTYLKEAREKNGVSLLEAAEDLQIDSNALENIEEGNVRAFKDMFTLKELVKDYAKYLGLDPNQVVEDFNDFLFEHTSKISLDDIKELVKKKETEEKKVSSPYTNIPKPKRDYTVLKKSLIIAIVIFIILFIIFKIANREKKIDTELKERSECYEFTY